MPTDQRTIIIDPELQSLIPPLTAEEFAQLEANLLQDGCHDALIVWEEAQTLLDGHNRYAICERHGLPYTVHDISLPDLDTAKQWIITNQLGRRNLTPEQMSYYRGEQYNLQKRQGKRTDLTSHQSEEKLRDTSAQLADEYKVSKATIQRDGAYARDVDAIADAVGPEARHALLSRDAKVTQREVRTLARIATNSPQVAKHTLDALAEATTPKQARHLVQKVYHEQARLGAYGGEAELDAEGRLPWEEPPLPALVLEPEAPEADDLPGDVHRNRWGTVTTPPTYPQTSGDYEWSTPREIIALVTAVLGAIDVDPASCARAQETVQARMFYTREEDGLRQSWYGRVFLNPPYQMPDVAHFCGKLIEELDAGHTTEAVLLVNSVTETAWFQRIAPRAAVLCFPDERIRFIHATKDGMRPCQGQVLLYFGPQVARFCKVFGETGLLVQIVRTPEAQLDLLTTPAEEKHGAGSTEQAGSDVPAPRSSLPASSRTPLMQAVWRMLKQHQPCTNAQVADLLRRKREFTYEALQTLVEQGHARTEGQQYWAVDGQPHE